MYDIQDAVLSGYEGPLRPVRLAGLTNFYQELCEYYLEELGVVQLEPQAVGGFVRGATLSDKAYEYAGPLRDPTTEDGYRWLTSAVVTVYDAVEVALLFPRYKVKAKCGVSVVDLGRRRVGVYTKTLLAATAAYRDEYVDAFISDLLRQADIFLEIWGENMMITVREFRFASDSAELWDMVSVVKLSRYHSAAMPTHVAYINGRMVGAVALVREQFLADSRSMFWLGVAGLWIESKEQILIARPEMLAEFLLAAARCFWAGEPRENGTLVMGIAVPVGRHFQREIAAALVSAPLRSFRKGELVPDEFDADVTWHFIELDFDRRTMEGP